MNAPYLPGKTPPKTYPLARHLPAFPGGLMEAYLPPRLPRGAWVCFPFGEAPLQAIEAARLGYRVLVVTSNPVLAFLHEILASPGEEAQWQAALAHLAATRIAEQRLEPYLRGLYDTECPACGKTIPATAFLWRRNAAAPHARLLTCPHCGASGLYRATPADVRQLQPLQRSYGLHSGRALQRVTPPGDPLRPQAEAALKTYLPRALVALFTLLNQAQRLRLPQAQQRRVHALLLAACDRATTLWPHPETGSTPRSLRTPAVFSEWNVWQTLEEAAAQWSGAQSVPCVRWPQMPPASGGICVYRGRLQEAAPVVQELEPGALIAAIPRPNAPFWKQAILWSGWLWGREAIGPWKSLLRRYRYTWDWHTALLGEAWQAILPALTPQTPILGLLPEDTPACLRAALIAAEHGGLHLHALARRPGEGVQIHWQSGRREPPPTSRSTRELQNIALQGALQHLAERAESTPWDTLHAAALCALAEQRALTAPDPESPERNYKMTTAALRRPFAAPPKNLRFTPPQAAPRARRYSLHPRPSGILPLADRAEMCVVRTLIRHPGYTLAEVDAALCEALPGLLTPERALLLAILDSYAEEAGGRYRLRVEDAPQKRRADLRAVARALESIGERLGARVAREGEDAPRVRWHPAGESAPYVFHIIASALAGCVISGDSAPAARRWIVLPGSRAGLLLWKMRRDPALAEAIREAEWGLLKFRHVRQLAAAADLTWEGLQARLELDPFTAEGPQLPLF